MSYLHSGWKFTYTLCNFMYAVVCWKYHFKIIVEHLFIISVKFVLTYKITQSQIAGIKTQTSLGGHFQPTPLPSKTMSIIIVSISKISIFLFSIFVLITQIQASISYLDYCKQRFRKEAGTINKQPGRLFGRYEIRAQF